MNHEDRALLLGMLRSHKIASISGCESKLLSYVLLRGIKVMKAISFHKNITDAGLAHLAGGCGGLTSVDLSGCYNITDTGLASFKESLGSGCRVIL